ncbi:MAG: DUF4389 domain-containing protein [Hahellaceae bacterium]|nr:DUF4389 domain-containing protein [Hahellaceae bacterium]
MSGQSSTQTTDRLESFMRLLYMVLFYIVYKVLDIVILLVAVVQLVTCFFSGAPNAQLQQFGGSLSSYVQQIVSFLTYDNAHKPYPFSEWPQSSVKRK